MYEFMIIIIDLSLNQFYENYKLFYSNMHAKLQHFRNLINIRVGYRLQNPSLYIGFRVDHLRIMKAVVTNEVGYRPPIREASVVFRQQNNNLVPKLYRHYNV